MTKLQPPYSYMIHNDTDNDKGYDADEERRVHRSSKTAVVVRKRRSRQQLPNKRSHRRLNIHMKGVRMISAAPFDQNNLEKQQQQRQRQRHLKRTRKHGNTTNLLVPIHSTNSCLFPVTTECTTSTCTSTSTSTSALPAAAAPAPAPAAPSVSTQQQQHHQQQQQPGSLLFVEQAIALSTTPHLLMEASTPHRVVHANAAYHVHLSSVADTVQDDDEHLEQDSLEHVVRSKFGGRPVVVHPVWVDDERKIVYHLVVLCTDDRESNATAQQQHQQQQQAIHTIG